MRRIAAVVTIACIILSLLPGPLALAEGEPVITGIDPVSGSSAGGYTVKITGSGFTPGKTTVKFDTQDAEIVSNTGTELIVTVPPRVNFEQGSSQPVYVVVKNEIGETISPQQFTYVQSSPQIDTVTPGTGTAGTEITIVGDDFIKGCIVVIGGIESSRVTFTDKTLVKAIVPANTAGLKSVKIINPDGGAVTAADVFEYEKSTPKITKVDPNRGPINTENSITITGDNFVPNNTTVMIGDKPAVGVTVVNQTTITAKTPVYDTVGKRHVTVTVDGVSAILYNGYEYISNPQVTSASPDKGSVLGGETVYIEGSGFMSGATVKFGTKAASKVEWKTSSLLAAITPAATEPGLVSVTVTNPDGGTFTKDALYEYTRSAPTIDLVSPASGSVLGGTAVTINGSDFRDGVKAYIDGKELSGLERISATELRGKTPPNDVPGGKTVKVVNLDGGTVEKADGFTYTRTSPQITSFEPDSSSSVPEVGAQVTITGADFVSGAVVSFGTKQAQVVSVENNKIVAKIPENLPGKYKITVTNPDKGEAVSAGDFTYVPSSPQVDSVVNVRVKQLIGRDVATGASSGGTEIRLTGRQFSENAAVFVGDAKAQVVSVERTPTGETITAVTPAGGSAGPVNIKVVNPDAQEALAGFTYIIAPTIADVFPPSGYTTGGTGVTISGTGFKTGLRVFFGGIEAAAVSFKDSTKVVATTPENSEGPKDVVLINTDTDCGMAERPGGFTYELPPSNPSILGFSPTSGSTEGGTLITVKGTDFRAGVTVLVGSVPAQVTSSRTVTEDGITYSIVEAKTGPGPAGDYRITVKNPDGGTAVSDGYFTYKTAEKALTVSSITPNSGSVEGGTFVTIAGANFAAPTGPVVTRVTIGGNPLAGLTVSSDLRRITGYTPGGTAGAQDVVVQNINAADGVILEEVRLVGGFTYTPPMSAPFIQSIDPTEGPVSGGTRVKITGFDFDSGAEVYFGTIKSTDVKVADTVYIEAVTPKSVAVGAVTVKVVNSDGGTATYDSFRYRGNTLVVSSVTPAYGSASGYEKITIKGANFIIGTKVDIGGEPAPQVTVVDTETLEVLTPPNTVGVKDVKVYNDYGASTLKGAFTYYLAQSTPYIDRVSGPGGDDRITAAGGDVVHIYGGDFRTGARVLVGGVECPQVTVASVGEIIATTPAGVPGLADLYIENPDGGTAYLEDAFTYISSPVIESLDPAAGTINGGTPVTIRGKNFEGSVEVTFDGTPAGSVEVETEETIRVTTPPHAAGYVNVKVVNTTDGGEFTKPGAFRYKIPTTAPEINSVLPDQGSTDGGTFITVNGDGFERDAFIIIGGRRATDVSYKDPRTLTAKTPPGNEGPQDVYVINAQDTGQAMLKGGFTYKTPSSAPTVSKVEPAKGSIFGGTDITITGTDFRAGARVIIGGAEAAGVEVVSPIRIKAVTPARPQGKAPVTVMNPDAGSATLKDGFEYVAPATLPEITGVNPGRGSTKGGTVVTITGREFADGAEVYIGGERCPSVELVSASELIIITPPGTPGVKDVVVVNPDTGLARLDDAFEYVVPNSTPVIKSIGPVKGSVLGGTRVSIQGSDFRAGARITFGGRDAGVVSIRDEQGREVDGIVAVSGVSIVVTTPPNTPGKKDVVVENPDAGVATLAEGFEYVDVSGTGMQIDGIWPEKGRVEGGTPVTITGSGFAEGAAVYIGGAPATNVHVVDEKTVKARTPANTAGKKDVTVQNPDGSACTLTDGFEYMVPGTQPDIISVEPNAGSTAGGTRIEIKGRNFDNPIVFIGETRAEPVSLGPTLIVVITPPGAPGPADVIVVNEDTGLDILEEGFTYKVYPTITSVTPNSGPTAGGTRITIFGTAFAQGAAVFIGDKAATDVNFVSETTLTALTPAHDPGAKPVVVTNPDGGTAELPLGFTYIAPRTAPEVPGDVSARPSDENSIRLSWSPALHANYYEIYISDSRSGPFEFIEKTGSTAYYLNDLEPDTRYYIQVRAVNELGVSEFTRTIVVTTRDGKTQQPEKPEKTQTVAGSVLETFINNKNALGRDAVLDMNTKDPKITSWKVTFAYEAITDYSGDIWIKAPGVTVKLSSYALRTPLASLNEHKSEGAGVVFGIERLSGRDLDEVVRRLPKNASLIGSVYRLNMTARVNEKQIPVATFYPGAWIYLDLLDSGAKNYKLYNYDEYDREWEAVPGDGLSSATINSPGIYGCLALTY